jgi:predicted DNA-binding transcriptional regulator AlpA
MKEHITSMTKEQLQLELGLSKATFYRRLKEQGVKVRRGLLSPEEADLIRQALGWPKQINSVNAELK